jgi:FKBP-type peptidyl-prolyl cis-trans isomerase
MNLKKFSTLFYFSLLFVTSCKEKPKELPPDHVIQQTLQKANKQIASEQKLLIENYCKRRKWKMNETGSGLYYMIYDSVKYKNLIKSGENITLKFSLKTIEGNEIYTGDNPRTLNLMVESSTAESGLHELVQKMKRGEKAVAILPSHLAFGLTGDENIPPYAVLVYDLKVLENQE